LDAIDGVIPERRKQAEQILLSVVSRKEIVELTGIPNSTLTQYRVELALPNPRTGEDESGNWIVLVLRASTPSSELRN
jgi:hypothetical protein